MIMPKKQLWIASIKVKVLEGSQIDISDSEFDFVECLYLADSDDDVVLKIKQTLPGEKLELLEVLKCSLYNKEDWNKDSPMVNELINDAAKEASESQQLCFGPFIACDTKDGRKRSAA
jgi:hypothetical protein